MLRLLKVWLETSVEETDAEGHRRRTTRNKDTVNETKTGLCRLPEESFDFLGYTQGRNDSCRTEASYLGPRPSRKKIDRLRREISELTEHRKAWQDVDELIGKLNRKLRGWSNYFRIGTVSKAYRSINSHTRHRVRQWLCAKFKVRGQGERRFLSTTCTRSWACTSSQRT